MVPPPHQEKYACASPSCPTNENVLFCNWTCYLEMYLLFSQMFGLNNLVLVSLMVLCLHLHCSYAFRSSSCMNLGRGLLHMKFFFCTGFCFTQGSTLRAPYNCFLHVCFLLFCVLIALFWANLHLIFFF